jgi:hypothetical protein
MSRRWFAPVALALLMPLAACTPSTVGGIRGETAFVATARLDTIRAEGDAGPIATCFRNTAEFLPRSRFAPLDGGGSRYSLAGYGLWFEDIRFVPQTPTSTLIEIRTSGNYDARWMAMFSEQRLEPLMACVRQPEQRP